MRVLLGLTILLVGSPAFVCSQDAKAVKLSAIEKEILDLTNAARKENDAGPLTPNPILMTLARDHSENQAKQGKMSHELDGKSPVDRVRASGYKYRATGENVAYNHRPSGKEVFEMWMKSPGHRKNILNPAFNEIGIGASASKAIYYTQVFGRSAGPVAAAVVPNPTPSPKPKSPASKGSSSEVSRRTLPATGWVTVSKDADKTVTGTGVLVDQDLRLFVTTYHLVEGVPAVNVYFPKKDAETFVTDPKRYLDNETPVMGELVIRNSKRDLAVFRLKSLPAGVTALKLAEKGAAAAERISAIGNSAAALWTSADGTVKQTVFKKFRRDDQQSIAAWMIETTLPTDKSDSGGPVVNERGELVGIQGPIDPNEPLLGNCIEVREIQAILELARGELTSAKDK